MDGLLEPFLLNYRLNYARLKKYKPGHIKILFTCSKDNQAGFALTPMCFEL